MTNLSQDFMDRWYGELKIIKRLHHPNVVRALDEPPGLHYEPMGSNVPFICMEYCDMGDLRQVGVVWDYCNQYWDVDGRCGLGLQYKSIGSNVPFSTVRSMKFYFFCATSSN